MHNEHANKVPGKPQEDPWQQALREFACQHTGTVVAYRITSSGSRNYFRQCRRCGENVKRLRRADLAAIEADRAPAFDEELRRRWFERRLARSEHLRVEARDRERREFQERYARYLLSPAWKAIRARVLRRANGVCEGCLERKATQVHHLTYERVGREMLFDLVAVCDPCHNAIHSRDGDRTA